MIQINLLPKDYLKGQGNFSVGKNGLYIVAGAIGVIALLIGVTFYQINQVKNLTASIDRANERAAMLQKDIRLVDALIDVKNKINRRMEAVEKLDRHRSVWVRILQDVSSNVPDFVWLAELREKTEKPKPDQGNTNSSMPDRKPGQEAANVPAQADSLPAYSQAEIEGYAFTLNSLAAFMISLMKSDYFDQVELVSTKETKFAGNEKAYNFVVGCNVHYLTDEQLQKLVAQRGDQEGDMNEADYEEAVPPAPNPKTVALDNQN